MLRGFKVLLIILIIIPFISPECSEGQIDINTASAVELDKIIYVGPVTAENIIASRLFSSIDDLIRVSGIGEIKLQAIKEEGLACVETSEISEEETSEEEIKQEEIDQEESEKILEENEEFENLEEDEKNNKKYTIITSPLRINSSSPVEKIQPKELKVITLNSKDIKEDNSIFESKKENYIEEYAGFGLTAICILLLGLLFLQKKKNELQ